MESWLWNPGNNILAVESRLWDLGCVILAVKFWLRSPGWNPNYGFLAVQSLAVESAGLESLAVESAGLALQSSLAGEKNLGT